jgi:streptogramin lyase
VRTWTRAVAVVVGLAISVAVGSSPAGAASLSSLLVASENTNQVLRYDSITGAFQAVFVSAGSGGLTNPHFIAIDPDRNVYVTSATGQILRYNGFTGAFLGVFVAAGSGGLVSPQGLAFGLDGQLYVADAGTNAVLRYSGTTGAFINVFVPAGNGLAFPLGLIFGPDGNLYVANHAAGTVTRYSGTTGAFIGTFVTAGSGGLNQPIGLTFGTGGDLYVASELNDQVLRYNGTTGAFVGVFVSAGSGGLDGPADLVFGPNGNLYVSSQNTDAVLRYNGTTGQFIDAFVPSGSGGLDPPIGLLFVPTFDDVPVTDPFFPWIEALFRAGITGGCSTHPPLYCPKAPVTRAHMAVFLLRGIHGADYDPPAPTGFFIDVPVTHPFAKWIDQLAREQITGGCAQLRYCPDADVTRGEMAVFLLRAEHGATYEPPAATGLRFTDVPASHPFAKWIEQLAREGITGGCGPTTYCPDAAVTREEMAVFLVRTFALPT